MAKVTGPLHSDGASGSIANAITFSKWKGRAYVRQLVTPKNMRTADQQLTRGYLGVIAKAAKAVLTAFKDTLPGLGSQFFIDAVYNAPSGQSWISYLQRQQHDFVDSLNTTYTALSGTIKGYYDDGADVLGLFPYITVGDTPVTYTKGFQVYLLAVFAASSLHYTGFASGPDAASSGEITAFETYVQTSA